MEYMLLCSIGLEKIVSNELKKMGYKLKNANNGIIEFKGEEYDYYKLNLLLRTAERVMIKIGEFYAETFDELFDGILNIDLKQYLPKNGKIIIDKVRSSKSKLYNKSVIQSIIKKSIIENLKKRYKINTYSEEKGVYKIRVYIKNNKVTLALDTSGEGLHKRGYRKYVSEAPLRETIAAAMILKSGWKRKYPLIDPFCGSGTIPIEGVLYGVNIPPGIYRNFSFNNWHNFNSNLFDKMKKELLSGIDYNKELKIYGYDKAYKMIEIARKNADIFDLNKYITFVKANMESINLDYNEGHIITNPPYGDRLKDKNYAEKIYEQMRYLKRKYPNFKYTIITSHEDFEEFFGSKAKNKKKIINGNHEAYIYYFEGV